jgi:hypothetical protein
LKQNRIPVNIDHVTPEIEARADSGSEARVRRLGRKPFGYFQGEPEAILKMKSLREQGLGFDRIAAELNKEGIPTRSRKLWHGVVVNRILSGRKPKQG